MWRAEWPTPFVFSPAVVLPAGTVVEARATYRAEQFAPLAITLNTYLETTSTR